MHEAKTHLSKLIERALAGEEVVIARHGAPVVRLQPVTAVTAERRGIVGCMADEISWPAPEAERRLNREIASEMSDGDKFDVELSDEVEFIPARPR